MVIALISAMFSLKWLCTVPNGKHGVIGTTVWILAVLAMNVWSLFSWRKSATVYRLLKP
jgi:hypothetical protein